jgi:hypothetical protein
MVLDVVSRRYTGAAKGFVMLTLFIIRLFVKNSFLTKRGLEAFFKNTIMPRKTIL